MNPIDVDQVKPFIDKQFDDFYVHQLQELRSLTLSQLIRNENPYQLSWNRILTVQDFVKYLVISQKVPQEELFFDSLLTELAIFICNKVYEGN